MVLKQLRHSPSTHVSPLAGGERKTCIIALTFHTSMSILYLVEVVSESLHSMRDLDILDVVPDELLSNERYTLAAGTQC